MSNKKYHYFYKITNKINGHFYYGVHNTSNLNDGYMGSGTRLQRAYKKYGIENFTKEILKFFDTTKEAFDYEAEVVNEICIEDKDCYNIKKGGKETFLQEVCVVKDNNNNIFCCSVNDPRYLNHEFVGVTKGKVTTKDKNGKIYSVEVTDDRYKTGELVSNMKGMLHTKDKNGKVYTVDVNDPRYLSGELIPLYTGTKWSDESKNNLKKIFAEKEHQKGEKNSQFGTKWMYKNNITKKVKKEEIEKYLSDGWSMGRVDNRKMEA